MRRTSPLSLRCLRQVAGIVCGGDKLPKTEQTEKLCRRISANDRLIVSQDQAIFPSPIGN